MSEVERAEAIKSLQMELFQIKQLHIVLSKKLRRQRRIIEQKIQAIASRGVKMCRQCREEMDVEQFSRDKQKSDGRDSYCLECRSLRHRKAA